MNLLPQPVAVSIIVVTTLVWVGDFVAQFVFAGHQTSPLIHFAFMGLVGGAFAASRKGPGEPPPPPEPTPPAAPEPPGTSS